MIKIDNYKKKYCKHIKVIFISIGVFIELSLLLICMKAAAYKEIEKSQYTFNSISTESIKEVTTDNKNINYSNKNFKQNVLSNEINKTEKATDKINEDYIQETTDSQKNDTQVNNTEVKKSNIKVEEKGTAGEAKSFDKIESLRRGELLYPINKGNESTNAVTLTFDDGFNKESIKKALDVLRKNNVKCTFFVVGYMLKQYPDLWKQAVEEGHLICNHTQNHELMSKLSNEKIINEILKWEDSAVEVFGQHYLDRMKKEFPYFRLPGGSGSDGERIMKIIRDCGYIPIGWNLETWYGVLRHYDLNNESSEVISTEVLNHVVKYSKNGSIILLHFNTYDTLKLEEIIKGIKDKGLEFNSIYEALPDKETTLMISNKKD